MTPEQQTSIDVRMRVGATPFNQVFEAFEGFLPPDDLGRGGHRRLEVKPFQEPGQVRGSAKYNPDYHVESSFNDEQYKYVTAAVVYLSYLARGTSPASTGPVGDFSTRVQAHFLNQEGKPSFKHALTDSTKDLLSDFGEYHPNLLPAMWATYVSGGGRGTEIALNNSRLFLQSAIHGELTQENAGLFLTPPRNAFVMEHPLNIWTFTQGRNRDYEVWCLGQAFAHTLMSQAKRAALNLSQIPHINDSYDVSVDKQELLSFQYLITDHVRDLTESVMPEQEDKVIRPQGTKEGAIVTDNWLAGCIAECIEDVKRKGQVKILWGFAEPNIFGQRFLDVARRAHHEKGAVIQFITGPIVVEDEYGQSPLLTLKEEGVIRPLLHRPTIADGDDFLVVELPKVKRRDQYHYLIRPSTQPSLLPYHHFVHLVC